MTNEQLSDVAEGCSYDLVVKGGEAEFARALEIRRAAHALRAAEQAERLAHKATLEARARIRALLKKV